MSMTLCLSMINLPHRSCLPLVLPPRLFKPTSVFFLPFIIPFLIISSPFFPPFPHRSVSHTSPHHPLSSLFFLLLCDAGISSLRERFSLTYAKCYYWARDAYFSVSSRSGAYSNTQTATTYSINYS